MAYPPVVVVDENDNEIGLAPLEQVWRDNAIHREVYIIVENDRGEVLLQKRSPHMTLYPDTWDISAAGHVDEGMTYEMAARMELEEEVGITGVPLQEIAYYHNHFMHDDWRQANFFVKIYMAHANEVPEGHENHHEVMQIRWASKDEMKDLVVNHPHQVAAGLRETYNHIWA